MSRRTRRLSTTCTRTGSSTFGRENPGTLDHTAALAGDENLRGFAAELDDRFQFVDLRSPEIGMGFSWGRYGPETEFRRREYQRLFAYARPKRKPGPSQPPVWVAAGGAVRA